MRVKEESEDSIPIERLTVEEVMRLASSCNNLYAVDGDKRTVSVVQRFGEAKKESERK